MISAWFLPNSAKRIETVDGYVEDEVNALTHALPIGANFYLPFIPQELLTKKGPDKNLHLKS